MNGELIKRLADSRKRLAERLHHASPLKKEAEEGGCGVVGFCCSEPVPGKHIYEPSRQMHNRGNGKGGGIAAVGLVPEQLGVSREVLDSHYLLHLAFIDTKARPEIEAQFITPCFDVAATARLDQARGLEVRAGARGVAAGGQPLFRARQTEGRSTPSSPGTISKPWTGVKPKTSLSARTASA